MENPDQLVLSLMSPFPPIQEGGGEVLSAREQKKGGKCHCIVHIDLPVGECAA